MLSNLRLIDLNAFLVSNALSPDCIIDIFGTNLIRQSSQSALPEQKVDLLEGLARRLFEHEPNRRDRYHNVESSENEVVFLLKYQLQEFFRSQMGKGILNQVISPRAIGDI